ncbi:MAG: hypothetical protein V4736_10685 [Bdellovibrionota bacterium]
MIEYFQFPLGGTPQFTRILGRVFVAALLLVLVPEVMNALATITDAIVTELGGFNNFRHVLDRLSDRLKDLSFSWVSIKDMFLVLISFLSFFILYVTIYLSDAVFVFSWMLLYILSPVLVSLYVLPVTASATTAMYRSMVQVCVWKIIWCVLSCLLWSFALSDINQADQNVDFLTAILVNLMLVFSVLMTPKLTGAFLSGGVASVADGFAGTMMKTIAMTPASVAAKAAIPINAPKDFINRKISRRKVANSSKK